MTTKDRHSKEHGAGGATPAEKPGARGKEAPSEKEPERSIAGRPLDPNNATSKLKFPPGVEPEEVKDPGRQTPDSPPVDNRS